MRVVATAGHVDHGKSSLVKALTGTDPDRFPEEKERGLTIDLGFAFCTLSSGEVVAFVDVPGHVRFVKNMLAGVGAVDVAVLVVAANEGWMPQTEEHAQILDLLDIRHGMVALTKAALVGEDTLDTLQLEVADRIDWPVVVVDSLLGRGLDDVRATLDEVLRSAPAPRDGGRPRVWVDRVFAAKGAGTVVTGTLTGGSLTRDQEMSIEPGGRPVRIRRIESHGEQLDRVASGQPGCTQPRGRRSRGREAWDGHRVSGSVGGRRHRRRGVADSFPGGRFRDGHRARARRLRRTARAVAAPRRGRPLRTTELSDTTALTPGDRLVLRSPGEQATVAGAEVLDVEPARRTVAAVDRLRLTPGARVLAARALVHTRRDGAPRGRRARGRCVRGAGRSLAGLAGNSCLGARPRRRDRSKTRGRRCRRWPRPAGSTFRGSARPSRTTLRW